MIRPLIVRRSSSHCANNPPSPAAVSFKMVDAMRAPYAGGFEISERCKIDSCDAMRTLVSAHCGPGAETK